MSTDGRSADALDAAQTARLRITDGRSADTLDAANTAQLQVADGRSPDTLDAALSPQTVTFMQPGGFDWADAGIGAGLATALMSVLAGSLLVWIRRHSHHRVHAT